MYECWALINGIWTQGWDVGTYKSTGATAFRPLFDMTQVFYVAEEDLCYAKDAPSCPPPGHCVECMSEGCHKPTCTKQYEERKNELV